MLTKDECQFLLNVLKNMSVNPSQADAMTICMFVGNIGPKLFKMISENTGEPEKETINPPEPQE